MKAAALLAAAGVLLGAAAPARGEDPPATGPAASALRIEDPPSLDGAVLADPAWQQVPPATGFWQTTPDEGQPASERTEVRVAYTADTLYFGVVCFDREPGRIIVSESRRDSPLEETDSFQIILDTFLDRQNGFVFGTNPAGIEYDGQVNNEGRGGDVGGAQAGGSGGGFNINWDAAWQVRTLTGDFGWSAEFAIPFRTLRYAGGGGQTWGLNFQRNIRRRKEQAFWAPLPRQFGLFHVSVAGRLQGLELRRQRNLKLAPYVLGAAVRDRGVGRTDWDIGGDLKYSLTPSLTLDLTLNTDFAQVEVDEQQINLDRFNLFFPEKRPFFLENAGLFAVGTSGEVEMFFSRRIGIGPLGEVVPILGGGRVSGKIGGASLGLLNMLTRSVVPEPGSALPAIAANNFTVIRLSRDLPRRSGIGGLFINRQATGDLARGGDHNRTYALDGRWGLGRYTQLSGFVARTETPGILRNTSAYSLSAVYTSQSWELSGKYTDVGEGFNPEVGFLRRTAFRKPELLVFHSRRLHGFLGLHEMRPHVSYRGYWAPDGFQESGFLHMDSHWEWKNGYEVHTGLNMTREGVITPFEIFPGVVVPRGTYDHRELQLVARTNQGAPVSFDGTFVFGGFFGGSRASLRPSMRMRVGETFNTDLRFERNDVALPQARFVTNLLRARVSYSFTPRVFAQALLQYNDRIDRWSTNLRFGWLQTANTGFFLVLNENRDTGHVRFRGVRDRSVILKFSRLVDVLD